MPANEIIAFYGKYGKLEEIKQLIEKIDVNFCDYDKRTPLHLASSEGHSEIVKLLLQNGAKVKKDRWGNTPIHEIEKKEGEHYNMIRNLLVPKESK